MVTTTTSTTTTSDSGGDGDGIRPLVVLVGPPGAGKSTVAVALAERLGAPVHDVDSAIEKAEQRSISDIFIDDGEPAFRVLERAEVARALVSETGVVALGGGAPMHPDTEADLQTQVVVFLDVSIADASKRVGFDRSRPLLAVNPRASWTAMMNARRPTYERVATVRVDTAGRTVSDIVDEIERVLPSPGSTSA